MDTKFKKGHTPWNKGSSQEKTADEKHPNWKGDSVGYRGLHYWIERKLGKASGCVFEDSSCKGRFEWACIGDEYSRDLLDWRSMCCSHHRRFDNKRRGYANNAKPPVQE